jgi:hypothetical protein
MEQLSGEALRLRLRQKSFIYYQVGKILLNYQINKFCWSGAIANWNLKTINFWGLYGSKSKIITALMLLFGGKISQLLSNPLSYSSQNNLSVHQTSHSKINRKCNNILRQQQKPNTDYIEQDNTLKMASDLLRTFIHKRYLYKQNLIVPKLLSFTDRNVLKEPPSPPFSSLGIPAKRFENYKRVIRDNLVGNRLGERSSSLSLETPLFQLSNIGNSPLANNFVKFSGSNTNTESSPEARNGQLNLTGIIKFYQNKLLKRHGQYLTNQWWNGQLSEHNPETVFLSDIDWRSSFIKKDSPFRSLSPSALTSVGEDNNLTLKTAEDILLDFPDSDQYYNPRRRRWLLNQGMWSFWFDLDKVYSEEILTTILLESITQTYRYLYTNTELLDFVTSSLLKSGFLKTQNNKKSQSMETGNNDLFLQPKQVIFTDSTENTVTEITEILLTNILKRF